MRLGCGDLSELHKRTLSSRRVCASTHDLCQDMSTVLRVQYSKAHGEYGLNARGSAARWYTRASERHCYFWRPWYRFRLALQTMSLQAMSITGRRISTAVDEWIESSSSVMSRMMSTVRDLFKGCSWRVCECQSESKSDFSGLGGESKNEKNSERFMAWPVRQLH